MGLAALALTAIGRLGVSWARSNANSTSSLLPTALGRLGRGNLPPALDLDSFPVPSAVWWLSLVWLEGGVWGFGSLLVRLGTRAGMGLGRLEGRYYLPLALILALVALLAVSR
jgi:hypothetical protein